MLLQILKQFTTKNNHPNFFSIHIQPKVNLQMKNENQKKTGRRREKEDRLSFKKKTITGASLVAQ